MEARDVCPTAAGGAPGSGAGAREACYSTSVFEGDGLRIDARVLWLSSPRAPGVGSGAAKRPALDSARPPPPQTIGVTPAPPPLLSVVRPAKRSRSSQPTLAQYGAAARPSSGTSALSSVRRCTSSTAHRPIGSSDQAGRTAFDFTGRLNEMN